MKPLWREAATLFLVAKSKKQLIESTKASYDYKILLLQRSAKSRFMPNFYVAPGGGVDHSDFSDKWMDLYQKCFKSCGLDFSTMTVHMKNPRPLIFRKSNTSIPSEIAFQICAIRETFEESGVLLLKRISDTRRLQHGCLSGENDDIRNEMHVPEGQVKTWRHEIYNDASKFITMCRELDCVPDVWSLGELANWLTPADQKIRYDTAFFVGFIDHEPAVKHDESEMIKSQLQSPSEIIINMHKRKYKVGYPHLYEILRFARFNKWTDLKKFQEERINEGCERWMPVQTKYHDKHVVFLPGDDLYNRKLDYIAMATDGKLGHVPQQEFTKDEDDLCSSQNLHRLTIIPKNPIQLQCSYEPLKNGQCYPLSHNEMLKICT